MRTAEAALDSLWAVVDQAIQNDYVKFRFTAFAKLLTSSRPVQRTPEWVKPGKSVASSSKAADQDLVTSLSDMYIDLEEKTSKTVSSEKISQAKEKPKTRGIPPSLPTPNSESESEASES